MRDLTRPRARSRTPGEHADFVGAVSESPGRRGDLGSGVGSGVYGGLPSIEEGVEHEETSDSEACGSQEPCSQKESPEAVPSYEKGCFSWQRESKVRETPREIIGPKEKIPKVGSLAL